MGVPVQVVLDVSPDIAARLAGGDLVRVGGVVRDAKTGQIVKHLGEGRLPAKEATKGVRAIAQRALNTTGGKVGVGIVVVRAVAVGSRSPSTGGTAVVVRRTSTRRSTPTSTRQRRGR